jgi:uncharacterized membrane protein
MMVALSVATNYAMAGLANVTIMDFIVFVGGLLFGPLVGALTGMFSWLIYGAINPYGFVPQIWIATMCSETVYGLMGGFVGRKLVSALHEGQLFQLSLFLGVIGFISTLIYDLATNAVFALVYGIPILAAVVSGTPFALLHELSNVAIFVLGCVPVMISVKNFLGVERIEQISAFAK